MKKVIVLLSLALGLQAHAERVKIDIGTSRIFAGYTDTSSDYNRIHYADAYCRYLGFQFAEEYSDGWEAVSPTDHEIMTKFEFDPKTYEPKISWIFPIESRPAAIYTSMECER